MRYGDFEWDDQKAASNARKHGVAFEEATTAFLDDLSVVYDDPVHADRFVLIGMSLAYGCSSSCTRSEWSGSSSASSARVEPVGGSEIAMKKVTKTRGPSRASLKEIPEIDFSKMRRLPGRGRYAHLSTGRMTHAVAIDPDLWPLFGSAKAINAALRAFVEAKKATGASRSGSKRRPAA